MSTATTADDRPGSPANVSLPSPHSRRSRFSGLFPQAPQAADTVWSIMAGVGVVAAGVVASVSRPGVLDSVWAEDGSVLLQATYRHSFAGSLLLPYNGYVSVPQRAMIWLVRLFPLTWTAALLTVMGAVVSCSCALLVYRASAAHVRSPMVQFCVIALPVMLLYFGNDVDNCLINIQWFLLYTVFWMVLWRPRSRSGRVLAAVVVFAAIAACPLALLTCAPLLLIRLRCVRWRENRLLAGALVAGVVLQGGAMIAGAGRTRVLTPDYNLPKALGGYLNQVIGILLVGPRELRTVPVGEAHLIGYLLVAAFLVTILLTARRADWQLAAAGVLHSLVLYLLLTMQGGAVIGRYTAAPGLLALGALAALVGNETRWRPVTLMVCVLIVGNVVVNYHNDNHWRTVGPSWKAEVTRARITCATGQTRDAHLVISPPGWTVTIPCGDIGR